MLNWLKNKERFLARQKHNDKANKAAVELEIINTHQRQGIALRHLKRYSEALQELTKAQNKLSRLQQKYKCKPGANASICKDINTMFSMTFTYFSNVYQDIQDKANAEKYLKLAVESSAKSENYPRYLRSLVNWYADSGDFDLAIETIFSALEKSLVSQKNKEIVANSETVEQVYRKLFYSISWDSNTGKQREDDSRDFVDTSEQVSGSNSKKYGNFNPEEDAATFVGFIVIDEVKGNHEVERYVREQMSEGNFEPAAKYLYFRYIFLNFSSVATDKGYIKCPKKFSSYITFNEVKDSLEQSPLRQVSTWTIHVIELIEKGSDFLNKHCQK